MIPCNAHFWLAPALRSVLAVLSVTFYSTTAIAIPPPFVSDRQLAERPVVVVAKWTGAPWKDNSLVEGNVLKAHEVATEIDVQRIVVGDIQPGKHTILVGYAIGWSTEQPWVMSYMSTEVLGDAEATKPNLWLLSRTRSRVDSKEYLYLDSYRGVQPLALEPYFRALQSGRFKDKIQPLLESNTEAIQLRILEQIAGGDPPWPYGPDRFIRPKSEAEALSDQVRIVGSLIAHDRHASVRRMATAVYAHIAGPRSVPRMRELLGDEDSQVRAISIGTLALHKDVQSADSMAKAAHDIDDPHVACELIKRLRSWNDVSAVPILIEFLQNDGFSYFIGNDLGIPAIKATETLRAITGFTFPFDVKSSRRAWSASSQISDRDQRNAHLAQLIPNDPKPWSARLVRQQESYFIVVTNRSKQTRVLAKHPAGITLSYSHGVFGAGVRDEAPDGNDAFVTCMTGQSIRFEIDVQLQDLFSDFLKSDSKSIDLKYMSNGNEFGLNAWIGVVSVEVNE